MKSKYETFDRSQLLIKPLSERKHDMGLDYILKIEEPAPEFSHPQLQGVAQRLIAARKRGAARILMMGAHVIKAGASRHVIDLIERGYLTHVALNGAGSIHDYELARIGATTESVARYIQALDDDAAHPFSGRRTKGFGFTGSWSSRLVDCGFHVNHVHPMGWISSCYYVGVPDAVADTEAKQGWIKFGEPTYDVGLSFRRAIQPAPGRLVLFPSYMWHGTVPFHGPTPRTTIAFDVAPT